MPKGPGHGQEQYDHQEKREAGRGSDGREGDGVAEHTGGQDQTPIGLEAVDERAAAQAGGAGTALAHRQQAGHADGAQAHGGGDFGDQDGEALIEHVGQAVTHGEAAEDERAVVLDAGGLGRYGNCGGQ